MNPTVSTHALRKHFGGTPAVDGVDIAITGGVVGLLGPNGAGKTTLLRMLATVLTPDSGDTRLLGLDPARPGDRLGIRRQLGYLPQEPGLYQGFSAFDLVDYVAGPPAGLAALAKDQVWVDDTPTSVDRPGRVQSWVTSEGRIRNIGEPPAGADLVDPSIDDGYLLLTNRHGTSRPTGRSRATLGRRLGRRLASIGGP